MLISVIAVAACLIRSLAQLRRFFDGAGGTWSCNEDGEAESFQNMKLIFLMRS